jgi:PHS family inorganic phosphate transporter-like MFS transporter
MISNYSTSYNAVNVGIVLPMLQYSMSLTGKNNTDEPYSSPRQIELSSFTSTIMSAARLLQQNNNSGEEEEEDSIVASSLLAGMIFGQLIGGYLGDVLGRRNAILFVMVLQIGGSIGSACISTSNNNNLAALEQLAIWRFFLGVGAGGVYPLAAVMAAESKGSDDEADDNNIVMTNSAHLQNNGRYSPTSVDDDDEVDHSAIHRMAPVSGPNNDEDVASFRRIALTFSTQGLGFITVPLIAYIMLQLQCNVDFIWRFLLGVGALPGLIVLFLRLRQRRRLRDKQREENGLDETILSDRDDENINEDSNDMNDGVEMASPSLLPSGSHDSNEIEPDNELALVEHSYIESEIESAANFNEPLNQQQSPSLWESIANEPNLCRKFVGTAGTWFLFDVLFYGNTLFEPLVLEAAFGSHDANDGYSLLQTTVRDSLVISLLSLPGYFVTVAVIGKRTCGCCSSPSSAAPNRCGFPSLCFPCYQTPTYIQMQGFFLMFILYLTIGLFWVTLSNMQWLLLFLYASSFFFANYGPNTTTFLLPSVTYSKSCRSTLNGISAAAGKLGALLGSAAFAPAADELGESTVMIFCGCVSLVALILTKVCVKENARTM